jgi:phage terminase large subunit-like protein
MNTRDLLERLESPPAIPTRTLVRRWETYARPKQLIVPERLIVRVKAGRGFGKTRLAVEHTLTLCERWGSAMFGLVAGQTEDKTFDALIHGESGLIRCAKARGYEVSLYKGVIHHPGGGRLYIGTGEDADVGRSKSLNYALLDEFSFWKYAEKALVAIRAALRKPAPDPGPHILVPSTPNVVNKLRLDDAEIVQTIKGSSLENRANTAKGWIEQLERSYKGHPMGAQELEGEDIDLAGSLATLARIHELRVQKQNLPEDFDAIGLYVDPGGFAIKNPLEADPTGAVVLALAGEELYVLHAEAIDGDEDVWSPRCAELAVGFRCGKVMLETNQGGKGILNTMIRALGHRANSISVEPVSAQLSKLDRALPTAQQYNLGHLHHVGVFKALETELTTWGPKSGRPSPNILDALAHGVNDILPDQTGPRVGPMFSPDQREIEHEDAVRGWAVNYFSVE